MFPKGEKNQRPKHSKFQMSAKLNEYIERQKCRIRLLQSSRRP